jgi:dTDP-4-amino-4,6-dideoxygalactose transaminase
MTLIVQSVPDIEPSVPLLDLREQHRGMRDEIAAALLRVADSQQFILGPEVAAFESEIAVLVGAPHAIGVSSGTDALLAALMALDITSGDEVITSTFSFFATAGCIARLGARPVLVDIDPQTFAVDPQQVAAAVTPRTRALMPVHLFGLCANIDPLVELARRHDLAIVEDAAQAIGSRYKGRSAGTIGEIGCFSFFPSKNLGAFGDGGLVVTASTPLRDRLRSLRSHGANPKYFHREIGGNFRLDAIQAAVLRVKARHLAEWTDRRRANAQRYRALFHAYGLAEIVTLPVEPMDRLHSFNQYVIRVRQRDELRVHLTHCGIGTEVYYPVPFHLQPCFEYLGHRRGEFPMAEAAASDVLAIPIYPELTETQQMHVVAAIASFFK